MIDLMNGTITIDEQYILTLAYILDKLSFKIEAFLFDDKPLLYIYNKNKRFPCRYCVHTSQLFIKGLPENSYEFCANCVRNAFSIEIDKIDNFESYDVIIEKIKKFEKKEKD